MFCFFYQRYFSLVERFFYKIVVKQKNTGVATDGVEVAKPWCVNVAMQCNNYEFISICLKKYLLVKLKSHNKNFWYKNTWKALKL